MEQRKISNAECQNENENCRPETVESCFVIIRRKLRE